MVLLVLLRVKRCCAEDAISTGIFRFVQRLVGCADNFQRIGFRHRYGRSYAKTRGDFPERGIRVGNIQFTDCLTHLRCNMRGPIKRRSGQHGNKFFATITGQKVATAFH